MPISPVSSTYSFDSAYDLSQRAVQKRYLARLDSALNDADLASAKRALGSMVTSSGEYNVSAPATDQTSEEDQTPSINERFSSLAQALDDNDAQAALKIWEQLKTDEESIAAAASQRAANADAAQARYALQMATESELYGALFDSTQNTLNSLNSLINSSGFGTDDSNDDFFGQWMTGTSEASSSWQEAMNNWITYNSTGSTNQGQKTDSIGALLNFSA